MPHLWEDQTTAAVENTLRAFKTKNRLSYETFVGELVGFADGDHASYMAGDVQVMTEDLALNDKASSNCYFQIYLGENWDNGKGGLVPQYLPFLKRLVQIKATLFHRHPTLSLVDVSGKTKERATKAFRDLLKEMRFTSRAKKLQKRTELVSTAFAYVRFDGDQLQLDVITPDNVEVYPHPDDPANLDKALLIRHRLPSLKDSPDVYPERWLVWERIEGATPALDEWNVYVMDNAWKVLDNPYFPKNVNPYKMYPYVVFNSEEQQDCIFAQLDDSLLAAQVGIDILATWYHSRQPDGLGIFKVTDPDSLPSTMPAGHNAAIPLGPADDFKFENIPFEADKMKTYMEMTLRLYASLHGLDPDVFAMESEAFTSALTGLARQMDRWDVQEVREDQEPYWEYKLELLKRKIIALHNFHAGETEQIDPSLALHVEWAQPEAPVDPQSQAQARKMALDLGYGDPIAWVKEDHNHASDEEAEGQLQRNLAWARLIVEATGDGLRQQRRILQTITNPVAEVMKENPGMSEAEARAFVEESNSMLEELRLTQGASDEEQDM